MYSFSYLEPVCGSMSSSNCCFLTCIQISQEAGQVVWYSHHFQNFAQFIVIHTVKDMYSQGYGFSSSHVWMWELDYKESWTPKNWCFWTVLLENTLERPLDSKEIQPVHPKGNQSWIFIWRIRCWSWNSNNLATWCKELTHLKRPWCWDRLRAGGEVGDRGWDVWMASLTQWTWVWVNSESWWWTKRLVGCGSWGSKELDMTVWPNWTELNTVKSFG